MIPSVRERVETASFPDEPGVYVIYRPGVERARYVGVAATQTLAERWRRQHLRPRAGGSALRPSLGVYLGLVEQKLTTRVGRYYPAEVEAAVTEFVMGCEVELFPTASADEADDLEVDIRDRVQPRAQHQPRAPHLLGVWGLRSSLACTGTPR
jgi:hypothetical protein